MIAFTLFLDFVNIIKYTIKVYQIIMRGRSKRLQTFLNDCIIIVHLKFYFNNIITVTFKIVSGVFYCKKE